MEETTKRPSSKVGLKSPAELAVPVTHLIIFSSLVNGRARAAYSERYFCACLNTEEFRAGLRAGRALRSLGGSDRGTHAESAAEGGEARVVLAVERDNLLMSLEVSREPCSSGGFFSFPG